MEPQPLKSVVKRDAQGRFLPGYANANPAGRPVNLACITACFHANLAEVGPDGKSRAQRIADKWVADLETGLTRDRGLLLKEALEREEGKVTDKLEVEVSGAVEIVTVEVRVPALDADQREHRGLKPGYDSIK